MDGAITNGERSQQGHPDVVGRHRQGGRRNVRQHEARRRRRRHEPDLHHGRLRRPRFEAADPPALRYARTDGQALGRSHRDAHHRELPRRPHRAGVLHLDPRRAQGPGRYGAQDRRLGLPHPPPGRRGAGRHRHRARLRHRRRHLRRFHRRVRRNHRAAARPHHRPRVARAHQGLRRQRGRRSQPADRRRHRLGHSGRGRGEGQDPLRAHLRIPARRLRALLRPQPRLRPHGRARRNLRRHRGAVHRRARHAAHHAYLPRRRHRQPRGRPVAPRRQEQRHRALHQPQHRRKQGRRAGGHEPLRLGRHR